MRLSYNKENDQWGEIQTLIIKPTFLNQEISKALAFN